MSPRPRNLALTTAFAATGACTLLIGLGSFGLLGPDEPRYAAIAAAMVARHGFASPILWGSPWLEKPVLYYWMAALSHIVGGAGDASARLPSAVCALAMCAALGGFLARAHSPRAGWLAAFMGVTSAFIVAFGRAATTDMVLTAPLAMGLMLLFLAWKETRILWLYGAAFFFAIATLAKGPVGIVLPGLVLILFAALRRQLGALRRFLRLGPSALFIAVAAPWYVMVQWKNPTFLRVFILQHNLERFATNRFEHPQPWWYYAPVLLLAVFPWTGWLGLPAAAAARRLRARNFDFHDRELALFLGCWAAVPVLLFSLSHSKLAGYILPAVPALIALIAIRAGEAWHRLPRWPLLLSAGLAGMIPAALRILPVVLDSAHQHPRWIVIALNRGTWTLALVTALALAALVVRRRSALLFTANCALMAGAVLVVVSPAMSTQIDLALSARPLARMLLQQADPPPIVVYQLNRNTQYGVQYYLGRALPAWTPASTDAIVLMDRGSLASFLRADYGVNHLASLGEASTPWLAVRVRP